MSTLLATVLAMAVVGQPATGPAGTQPVKQVAAASGPYKVIRTFELGGEGAWDYLAVDPDAHRLYVPRSTRVMVVDTETGKAVGEVPDTAGVHGVALALQLGKGFSSNGRSDSVTVFDLKTLAAEKTVPVGKNPDAIIFEPTTKRVFVFNGRGKSASVISTDDLTVVGTIELGGKPEFAAVDGAGGLFVNVEDTSELVKLNPMTMTVEKRLPLAPGEEPSGLAIDPARHMLFSVCSNKKMVIVDAQKFEVVGSATIGAGVDGAAFDPTGSLALSANGEGTMTAVSTIGDKPFAVMQTLATAKGARTMVMDAKNRRVYLPTAEFEAPAEGAAAGTRPKMKAGSFKIVVVGT